ncbi:hypothetical protein [Kineosporia babensis]|uniref:Uncharacterized protein n=1 Tax=Kineosporia babensis TaxID=499548 RepID=A0A9X1SWM7_9ACTN|nr:hypothetical protein [Kineosporia babensis]MCD5314966.1 hypothetical protein [Kineosporia babensis]
MAGAKGRTAGRPDIWSRLAALWQDARVKRRLAVGTAAATLTGILASLGDAAGLPVLVAAAGVLVAGVLFPTVGQVRYRHLTGSASAVLALASLGLLGASFVSEAGEPSGGRFADQGSSSAGAATDEDVAPGTADPDLSVQVSWDGENQNLCQQVITEHDDITQVPAPPPEVIGAKRAWTLEADAVDGGDSHLTIKVQGSGEDAIVLEGLGVRILHEAEPSGKAVYGLGEGCGAPVVPARFSVDLDQRPVPRVVAQPREDPDVPPQPAKDFPLQVTQSEAEYLLLDATAVTCDCTWEAVLRYSRAGVQQPEISIRDENGRPFRTSGLPVGSPGFLDDGAGNWISVGPVSDERMYVADMWTPALALYKPQELQITDDSSLEVENLNWSAWTGEEAVGLGVARLNTRVPDCTEGRDERHPVRIILSGEAMCEDKRFFTSLVVHWRSEVPEGIPQDFEYRSGSPC